MFVVLLSLHVKEEYYSWKMRFLGSLRSITKYFCQCSAVISVVAIKQCLSIDVYSSSATVSFPMIILL
ncbi:hypothetical protein DsansV1_C13g0123191 [Dioscorea sansibarensis]